MDIARACKIIQAKAYGRDTGVLEVLMDIKTNSHNYSLEELRAYFVFMEAGEKMFAPVEA
jgi:hypothetical protein